MNEFVALLLSLAIHELAHYAHFFVLGLKPKLIWVGIGPAVKPNVKHVPVKHVIINAFLAITAGLMFLISVGTTDLVRFAYIVGCFMDMNNIQLLIVYLWRKKITPNTCINDIVVTIKKPQPTF